MPEIKNTFTQGKMNKDLDDRLLPNGQYRDAENITVSKSESSNVGTVQNVKGNTYAYSSTLDTPQNLTTTGVESFKLWDTIGYYANSQTGDVFWFVTSFTGTTSDDILQHKTAVDVIVPANKTDHDDDTTGHRIVEIQEFSNYDIQVGMLVTGTNVASNSYVEKIVEKAGNLADVTLNKAQSGQSAFDTSQLTFAHTCRIYHFNAQQNTSPTAIIDNKKLSFSRIHNIHHVNLLGNLLFWTDNYNQPRRINIDKIGTSYYNDSDVFEDKISVAQFSPIAAPKVKLTKVSSSTIPSLHLRDKFIKFGYRYVYDNNEVSLISPFSQTCFLPGKNKNINHGSFKSGDAGLITQVEAMAAQKTTVLDSMQNMVNRVHLFIDLPNDANHDTQYNFIAAADAGVKDASLAVDGHMVGAAGSNQSIHSISASNVIDNTTTLLTERGDKYTIASYTQASNLADTSTVTLNEEIPSNLGIFHNEPLYFFKSIQNYNNPLNIKRVEIVYVESDSPTVKIVDTIKIPSAGTSLNAIIKHRAVPGITTTATLRYGIEFIYDSTKPIKTLPEQDITRVADIVPLKAQAQEISGNRLIYGNFKLNRPITNLIDIKDNLSVTNRDQTRYNSQYLLHSVKQAREYSVGLVLSDRYGRQSTVFLPTANTTYVTPKDTDSGPTPITPMTDTNNDGDNSDSGEGFNANNRWNGTALNIDFGATITDTYNKDTNPYGWYSYKVVVKQPQQEYYNIYVPSLIDEYPTNEKSSWITLFGDNVNKVPRDVIDGSLENNIESSKTKLLPKILNVNSTDPAAGLISGGYKQQNTTDFAEIIAIGTTDKFGSNSIEANNNLINKDRKPLVAELPDGFGGGSGPSTSFLCVFETDPFVSALDIYFETSTSGLISDLNAAIQAQLGATPSGINLSANTFAENIAANTQIAVVSYVDTNGASPSGPSFTLESVTDGSGADRKDEFQISGTSLKTASGTDHLGHVFENRPKDTFTFEIKVTDASGNTLTQSKTITLQNVAPSFLSPVSSLDVPDNTQMGTSLVTYSGVNGAGKTSSQTSGLGFTISAGNSDAKFGIGGTTGILVATDDFWTSGDTYTLTITLTDAGGLTASQTLNITITSATVTRFWRSAGNTNQTSACTDDGTGNQAWHDGLGDLPSNGDKVYTNNTGTTLFNGQNAYYIASASPQPAGDGGYNVRINVSGVVTNAQICSQ